MIDELSGVAAKLLLSLLYDERVRMGRRQRFQAQRELEDLGIIRVTSRAPKPPTITIITFPGVRQFVPHTGEDEEQQQQTTLVVSSKCSTTPEATELEPLEPVSPEPRPLQGPIRAQFTGSEKDTVTVPEKVTVSEKDTVIGSKKDTVPEKDTVTGSETDTVDLCELADAMEVDENEGYRVGTAFWKRRQAQLKALKPARDTLCPQVTDENLKEFLGIARNSSLLVWRGLVRSEEWERQNKRKLDFARAFILKFIRDEIAGTPPPSSKPRWTAKKPASTDAEEEYMKPFDGQLEELTPAELEERRSWAEQIKQLRRVR